MKKAIPHLKYLDEELLTDEASPTKKCNVFDDDWAYLEELQKDVGIGGSMESIESSQGQNIECGNRGLHGEHRVFSRSEYSAFLFWEHSVF